MRPSRWIGRLLRTTWRCLRERISGERAENLEQAIACCQQALQVYTREALPMEWAMTQHNLGNAYLDRIRGERAENLEQAITCYKQTLDVYVLKAFPYQHRQTQRTLGSLGLGLRRWSMAAEAFHGALAASDLLYAAAATPEARQAELSEVNGVAAALAYSLAQQAEGEQPVLQDAVVTLERNRARWLAEALALSAEKPAMLRRMHCGHNSRARQSMSGSCRLWRNNLTQSPGNERQRTSCTAQERCTTIWRCQRKWPRPMMNSRALIGQIRQLEPGFMPEPSFSEIQHALGDAAQDIQPVGPLSAGVYLITTAQGGLCLIVHAGESSQSGCH